MLTAAQLPSMKLDGDAFFATLDEFQRNAFRRLRFRYTGPNLETFCKLIALKTANALAVDYHFRNRNTALVSRPISLQIDPVNHCHLRCPSCLHSGNTGWASRFDWPAATLAVDHFEEFCNEFGPFGASIALFRDGEPLLHRRFPEFVTIARRYLMYTVTSTNLSMRIDAESLVASGLDRLVAGIDGASAATYSRYRQGGNFDLVIENLRAIVRARKAQSSSKPWLVWQFLAFEHNVHEAGTAAAMAREIGVDQLVVARPHSVEHDDPSIKVAEAAPFGDTLFGKPHNWCSAKDRASTSQNAGRIDRAFSESWRDRYIATGCDERGSGPANRTCHWLYSSLTMDAARRITPCCLPPMGPPEPRHLVFAKFTGRNTDDVVNSSDAILARRQCRSVASPDMEGRLPYCVTCTANPQPPVWPDVSRYLASVDELQVLPAEVYSVLASPPLFA